MFGWRRRKAPAAPLTDWLCERTSEWLGQYMESQVAAATDGNKLLGTVIIASVLTAAGSFIRQDGRQIVADVGIAGPDTLAFEVLAFSYYAIRESHLPTPDDPLDDFDPEELVEGYRDAFGTIMHLISKQAGWNAEDVWQRRVMFYFQQKSMKQAAESFVGVLLTMKDTEFPSVNYGRLSLDLQLNLTLRGRVHSYASAMPKAMADIIQDFAVEYGLIL